MSTVVYQNIQPVYESNNFTTESRQLSLKLNPPKDNSYNKSYSNMFGWNGIEPPSNKEEPIYIHPLVKRSSSKLSQKSLEMCTESLGCETGTCIMESSPFFQSTMSNDEVKKRRPKTEKSKEITHVKLPLPPPLTTISGPNSIRVEPVREYGRLVIKAVSSPPKHSCLQAERSNGRLRLSLVRDDDSLDDETLDNNNNEDEVYMRNDSNDNDDGNNDEGRTMVAISNKEEDEVGLGENMSDVKIMMGVKVGIVKIQRPSRCKDRGQGNKSLVNWEPFWVAT